MLSAWIPLPSDYKRCLWSNRMPSLQSFRAWVVSSPAEAADSCLNCSFALAVSRLLPATPSLPCRLTELSGSCLKLLVIACNRSSRQLSQNVGSFLATSMRYISCIESWRRKVFGGCRESLAWKYTPSTSSTIPRGEVCATSSRMTSGTLATSAWCLSLEGFSPLIWGNSHSN